MTVIFDENEDDNVIEEDVVVIDFAFAVLQVASTRYFYILADHSPAYHQNLRILTS